MRGFGLPIWTMYVIGVVELVSFVLLFTRWMLYGASALIVIGIGAVIEHLTHGQAVMAIGPLVLAVFVGIGAWLRAPGTFTRSTTTASLRG